MRRSSSTCGARQAESCCTRAAGSKPSGPGPDPPSGPGPCCSEAAASAALRSSWAASKSARSACSHERGTPAARCRGPFLGSGGVRTSSTALQEDSPASLSARARSL
eukprot:scaffold73265_cov69-Phaeocystis_antarctica.AAC.5